LGATGFVFSRCNPGPPRWIDPHAAQSSINLRVVRRAWTCLQSRRAVVAGFAISPRLSLRLGIREKSKMAETTEALVALPAPPTDVKPCERRHALPVGLRSRVWI